MIKAIIFDFDGTIIDTETSWYVAFRDAYEQYGVELTLEMYSQCIGTSLHTFNPYEYLVTDLHLPIDLDQFRESIHARHDALMEGQRMRDGVATYLQAAKELGLKVGVASSSKLKWVERFLDRLQIKHDFDCIRTADHVKKVKPDPELYIQAAACLGVQPFEAIAIEDSPNGAKAAMAAGIYCVVAPNSITKLLPFDPVDHMVGSLTELNFHDLLNISTYK